MLERGELYRTKHDLYSLPDLLNLVVGRLQVVRSGAGFVVAEDRAQNKDRGQDGHGDADRQELASEYAEAKA